jgi:hypothetical protein
MNLSSGTQSLIAGALYDFAAHLTTLPKTIKAGGAEPVYGVHEALQMWAHKRGLDLNAVDPDWSKTAGEVTLESLVQDGRDARARIAGALYDFTEYVRSTNAKNSEDALVRWATRTGLSLASPQPRWAHWA